MEFVSPGFPGEASSPHCTTGNQHSQAQKGEWRSKGEGESARCGDPEANPCPDKRRRTQKQGKNQCTSTGLGVLCHWRLFPRGREILQFLFLNIGAVLSQEVQQIASGFFISTLSQKHNDPRVGSRLDFPDFGRIRAISEPSFVEDQAKFLSRGKRDSSLHPADPKGVCGLLDPPFASNQ